MHFLLSFVFKNHGVNIHFGNLNSKKKSVILCKSLHRLSKRNGCVYMIVKKKGGNHTLKQSMEIVAVNVCWLLKANNKKKSAAVCKHFTLNTCSFFSFISLLFSILLLFLLYKKTKLFLPFFHILKRDICSLYLHFLFNTSISNLKKKKKKKKKLYTFND